MIFNLVLLSIIVCLFIVLSMIWPPDSPWAPWWKTNDKKIRRSFEMAKLSSKDIVYDLGSGDGRSLIIAAKEFRAKAIGVEIDPLRAFISKILIKLNGGSNKIKIIRSNFFDVDISEATVVFVYLVPKALERLRPKLLKELKKGTKVICINYEVGLNLEKADKDNKIRIYKI